ncbi:MAG: hypothetical protein AAGF12_07870 [Myxococcota bacterium]
MIEEQLQALTALGDAPEPSAVADVLRASFELESGTRYFDIFAAAPVAGPFERAELRRQKAGANRLLILTPLAELPVLREDLDLSPFGELRSLDINPRIPPSGTKTEVYALGGAKVSFQFHAASEALRLAVVEWGGNG